MPRLTKSATKRPAIAAYGCICAALLLLIVLSIWHSCREYQYRRRSLLQTEITDLRSQAERTVGGIERDLEYRAVDLAHLATEDWLRKRWQENIDGEEHKLYAAIVDFDGTVVSHSHPGHAGDRLTRRWYDRVAFEAGSDVFETRSLALTSGQPALDLRLPIRLADQEVGEYHVGFDLAWFQSWVNEAQNGFVRQRALRLGGVLLIVAMAGISLYYISTHSVFLRQAVDAAHVERSAELNQLAAGLAHEIRNPLHAIRLNLHTFRRLQQDKSRLSDDEVSMLLDQSSREIERIHRLMQELVGFASPEKVREELIDLKSQLEGVVEFIDEELRAKSVRMTTHFPARSVTVYMDPNRLRQTLLNVLHYAAATLEGGGSIEISLLSGGGHAEIRISDDGPGVPDADRRRIFEPFFAKNGNGNLLGLALAKRLIDDAGGEMFCEPNPSGGTTFRILFKQAHPSQVKARQR